MKFSVQGQYEELGDDELRITELPIGKWTRDYKNFLEDLAQKDIIDEIREHHEENKVDFRLIVPKLQEIASKPGGIEKHFKLSTTLAASNYVLFDHEGKLRRYQSAEAILEEWFPLRRTLYERRKEHQLAKLTKEHEMLRNKVRFIKAVIDHQINILRIKRKVIANTLKRENYTTMS